jgi:hypothetical protein
MEQRPRCDHIPTWYWSTACKGECHCYAIIELEFIHLSQLGQTTRRIKAEQLKLLVPVLPQLIFTAFRDGDEIPMDLIPRGKRNSTGGRHQVSRAKLLHKRRTQHFDNIGHPELAPASEDCFSSRDPRRHFLQIMRFCVAFHDIFVHKISPNQAQFVHQLIESACIEYTRMNVHMAPCFHQLLHIHEFILEYGSLYNTHTWPFERANHQITRVNNNKRGNGVLEGTMMKGWWTNSGIQGLVRVFFSWFITLTISTRYIAYKQYPIPRLLTIQC